MLDDIILTGNDAEKIAAIKKMLFSEFETTDLGLIHYCLGLEFWQTADGISVTQSPHSKVGLPASLTNTVLPMTFGCPGQRRHPFPLTL